MQFGGVGGGGGFSQKCVHYALHAINFSSEVWAVFLLRCVSGRKNVYLLLMFSELLRAWPRWSLRVRWERRVWPQFKCMVAWTGRVCVCVRRLSVCVCRAGWDACLQGCGAGWVAACRDGGIGKRSLSLRPTAKTAGDTTTISSRPPSLLSISLTYWLFSNSFPFSSPISFISPLVIFPLPPRLLMLSYLRILSVSSSLALLLCFFFLIQVPTSHHLIVK